jgi:hypothetical protein
MKDRVQRPLCDILSTGGRGANLDEAAFCEFCQGADVGVCDLAKASLTDMAVAIFLGYAIGQWMPKFL